MQPLGQPMMGTGFQQPVVSIAVRSGVSFGRHLLQANENGRESKAGHPKETIMSTCVDCIWSDCQITRRPKVKTIFRQL